MYFLEFPRIREDIMKETKFLEVGLFADLFGQNWPKFGCRFIRQLHFFIQPILTYTAEQSASFVFATQVMADSAA